MAELNNIKQLIGQPWSTWKKLCENYNRDDEIKSKNEYSNIKKLDKMDMPLFGLCPKTEVFELIVCNYCGLKYKLPAFAEHIDRRHNGDTTQEPCITEKPRHVPEKSKPKRPREKLKIKNESVAVKVDMKIGLLEIVGGNRSSLAVTPDTFPKLNEVQVTSSSVKTAIENTVPEKGRDSISTSKKFNLKGSIINHAIINKKLCEVVIVKKDDSSSTSLPQVREIINMQPIVKLSPIFSNSRFSDAVIIDSNAFTKRKKEVETEDKSFHYNPDVNCGVVENETSPCLQNLDCQIHHVSLKKLVVGRSKAYEFLLYNYLRENEKHDVSGVKSTSAIGSEVPSVATNPPKILDRSKMIVVKIRKSTDIGQQTRISTKEVFHSEVVEESNKQFAPEEVVSSRSEWVTNDLQGLSLPVSIQNPFVFHHLENIQSHFLKPGEPVRCIKIQDLLRTNSINKQSLLSTKENSKAVSRKRKLDDTEEILISKSSGSKKKELFQQWHPGYRKAGGLLYANQNIRYLHHLGTSSTTSSVATTAPPFSQEELSNSYQHQRLNVISDQNDIIELCGSDSVSTESRHNSGNNESRHNSGNNESISAVISKQKNNLTMTSNAMLSQPPQKQLNKSTNHTAFICKRPVNNINGVLPAKVKRKDGAMVRIISPVFWKK